MLQALPVLFGALFTAATAIAIGQILLRRARVQLYRGEETLLGFIIGSAVLSGIIFLLCAMKAAHRGVFLAVGIAAIALRLAGQASRPVATARQARPTLPPLPRFWKWLFIAGFATFTVVYLLIAMAPEFSPDGVAYHLAFVNQYLHAHGFVRITTNMYANLSQGVELLYLMAFAFGRHSSASVVHLCFLVVLALSILSYARRAGHPIAGVAASLLVYASPVVGKDATCAYIDVAVAAVVFGVFYFLQIWDVQRTTWLLVFVGLTAGFCYATKYTAALAIPYAIGFVLWRQRSWRAAATAAVASLILVVPWVVKNIIWIGNPVSPMLNQWFPNPVMHTLTEQIWTHYLSMYSLTSRWQIPWQLTTDGEKLTGFIGPVFLLAPLALLSLWTSVGRRLLFAGVLFSSTYFMNVGSRFAIQVLPFYALALAMVVARYQFVLAALAAAHCISSFPGMQTVYCNRYAWRLEKIPWKAALRIQSEDAWLTQKQPGYSVAKMIEKQVPPGQRVLSMNGGPAAYTNRELLVSFESAESEDMLDVFYAGFLADRQPSLIEEFRFAPTEARKIRVVQTAAGEGEDQWSVTEMRLYSAGRELQREPSWRLTANPNPWEIQMAFDNSPVTRWRGWVTMRPGMYIQVDLGKVSTVDQVRIEMSPDAAKARLQVQVMDAGGTWKTVSTAPVRSNLPPPGFLGEPAFSEIRARNVGYFYVVDGDTGQLEIADDPAAWGLTQVGRSGNVTLYRIDAPMPKLMDGTR